MGEETVNKYVNDNADSIEIGTPSKGGAIKVYGNASNKDEFKDKIDKMFDIRKYAKDKFNFQEGL